MRVEDTPPLDPYRELTRTNFGAIAPAAIVGLAVFFACLFGVYTRPIGFLATVWPANAIMLGLLVRVPGSATPLTWIAATIAFLSADLLTGSTLFKTTLLTGGNLAGIGAAAFLLSRLPRKVQLLRHPSAPLFLILAAAVGGMASGLVGALINPILFGGTSLAGWTFWFATETVNYLAILPVLLTAPAPTTFRRISGRTWRLRWADAAPAFALLLSALAAMWFGGPGALAFPIPALLWCALTYPLFATALLASAYTLWGLSATSMGMVPMPEPKDEYALISARIGISMVALAPLMVASVTAIRHELLRKTQHLADHDHLTGLLNRRAFCRIAELVVVSRRTRSVAVMMLDIDHFKRINDRYGHNVGDIALKQFAAVLRNHLRRNEILGRLGGEEFAVLIHNCTREDALALAERLRIAITQVAIPLDKGEILKMTSSFGVSYSQGGVSLDDLLMRADHALYEAKSSGRNKVVSNADMPDKAGQPHLFFPDPALTKP